MNSHRAYNMDLALRGSMISIKSAGHRRGHVLKSLDQSEEDTSSNLISNVRL